MLRQCTPSTFRLAMTSASALFALLIGAASAEAGLSVEPTDIRLDGRYSQVQIVVRSADAEGRPFENAGDLTRQATLSVADTSIAEVDARGRLRPITAGATELVVTLGGESATLPVVVEGDWEAAPSYDLQVRPVLSKAGCNMGACHAAQYGQGGFKLSVFAFEPEEDHAAIVRDRRGRRVDLLRPERSLLLRKPTMEIGHGGGRRLEKGSPDYRMLVSWLGGGAVGPAADSPKVTQLAVTPTLQVGEVGDTQQMRVVATYDDGTVHDVTAWARYDSLDEGVVAVDEQGLVELTGRGQGPLMVRFEDRAAIATFVVPFGPEIQLADWKNENFVDDLAAQKFRELGIEPSPLCDDSTFLRRVFADAVGGIPTVDEAKRFLESTDPKKREHLVDALLGLTGDPAKDVYNDRYAAYWTLKWSDLIRNNSRDLGDQGMWAMHNWIRESFRRNQPFDEFVREMITATGSIYSNGPANYYRLNKNSSELTESTAQLFLGVRLQCAQCHHHPFENISQKDYYSFAAFFARVGTKNSEEFGLFGRETVVMVRNSGDVRHPKTRELLEPTPLLGEPTDHPLDRRIALAEWLGSADNEYFTKSVVNRYVRYLLGRGLVEPVDDLRATNPPSNAALMEALSAKFVDSGFDLKQLMRTIMVSRLYQLDSQPTSQNAADTKFYSHFLVKRIAAEPLLDAIDQVTQSDTKFSKLPAGTAAIELPDAEYPNYFLTTFAKPRRTSVCECERAPDENLAQALHTLNGDTLTTKIADKNGRIARLLKEEQPHEQIVNELYLSVLSRLPSDEEMELSRRYLEQVDTPQTLYEDLMWALLNSKGFLFVQ